MCGIAGEIRYDGRSASAERVARMTRRLATRGPDSSGLLVRDAAAFGHRRLKIIDLSERGSQPMDDPDLGLSLVFNGCIYNYRALRTQLAKRGYSFFSDSDSEVILKAWHAWGERCVERFNGMFAFVIRERDSGRVFMARDRLGIKPLYYMKTPGALRFASSLPALLAGLRQAPEIDPVALHHYMTFHSVVPAPRTLFRGVCKLEPGVTRTFSADSGLYTERRYWQLDFDRKAREDRSEGELVEQLLAQLRAAVARRCEADVPVGVLLSGGVDSSIVTGLLAEQNGGRFHTFSIGFDDHPEQEGNEFRYSDIVARRFGTDHHRIRIDAAEVIENLPACIGAMAEPMVSHDNIGFYLLGRHVSDHIRVVQSGQGADEVFAGYHWYQKLDGSRTPVDDYARAFFDRSHEETLEAIDPELAAEDYSRGFVAQHFKMPGAAHPVDKALRLDTTVMLVDDPVKRVDNMTMAWGLEARVPFLDYELVEWAAGVPARWKTRDGGKYLLKEAARRVVPADVIDRPKGYFPVPALKYLQGETLDYVRAALDSRSALERGIFRRDYVERLLADPVSHMTPLGGSKLWQIATLELWLQANALH
jgi:asparagine synthase (glutamine-hydrolysing)